MATTRKAAQRTEHTMKKRVDAVVKVARQTGLIGEKSARIAGRVSPILVEEAKKRTGLQSDTDLIEFALANVAIEDNFAEEFKKLEGTVDPTLDLEF
ncbi:hypothetical protein [Phyllobacterium leguminum]|uniref:Uncharacterized protein n=1 Tax=Phyllobacterium leguminum TaxID=314237 RepID=A0A318T7Q0_9HYPH|nr:hypothetical protein [Phyllobacterium leguminum]PYE89518.1 hypothetical protein C7477_10325 [Phyllobacterium leguminum]